MYELFFREFNKKIVLTLEEQDVIKKYLTPKKLRKKQYLLQKGDVCKFIAFTHPVGHEIQLQLAGRLENPAQLICIN